LGRVQGVQRKFENFFISGEAADKVKASPEPTS